MHAHSGWRWRKRFGHLNYVSLKRLEQNKLVQELPPLKLASDICKTCLIGKQFRETFPKQSSWRADEVLKIMHADLCGPIAPASNSK